MEVLHEEASIFIPVKGSRLDSYYAPGSGIVGVVRNGYLITYMEGNLFGASNMHQPEERIACAYGRAATNYPTTAFRGVSPEEAKQLICVGNVRWPNQVSINEDTRPLFESYMARYKRAH